MTKSELDLIKKTTEIRNCFPVPVVFADILLYEFSIQNSAFAIIYTVLSLRRRFPSRGVSDVFLYGSFLPQRLQYSKLSMTFVPQ